MTMRDAFLAEVLRALDAGEDVFFLTADFGAPVLDRIRERHPERCLNVGIAEQNLINVAVGLGLEGHTVYAYAIAPFLTMRCFEQIRVNLAVLAQTRPMNVNLIGVGAGFSYDVSGPTHHCLEDISILRTLPGFEVLSPADATATAALFAHTRSRSGPKYLRLDAKALPQIHAEITPAQLAQGFVELARGTDVCLISTGYMTHTALQVARQLSTSAPAPDNGPGVIDLVAVQGFDVDRLIETLSRYRRIVTLEEGFVGKGGMDAAIGGLVLSRDLPIKMRAMGVEARYVFDVASRESMHARNGLDAEAIVAQIHRLSP